MKHATGIALFVPLWLCLLAPVALAQPEDPAGETTQADNAQSLRMLRQRLIRAAQPNAEQLEKLETLIKTHGQEMRAWQQRYGTQFRSARRAVQQARRSGDEEATQAAEKELREATEARKDIQDRFRKGLSEVLNEEQLARVDGALNQGRGRGPRGPTGMLEGLNLSEEQQQKARSIMAEAVAQARKTDDPEVKRALMEEALEKVKNTVLTEEQKKQFNELPGPAAGEGPAGRQGQRGRGQAPAERLGLSEEQQAAAQKIMTEAREKASAAETREERWEIYREAMQKVNDEVLTDEQRQKAEQIRTEARNRMQQRIAERLGMSEEQQSQSLAILEEARKKAEEADSPEARREIMRAARDKIAEDVLTKEQRKQIEQMRNRGGRRGRGQGDEGGDGPPAEARERRRDRNMDGSQDGPSPEAQRRRREGERDGEGSPEGRRPRPRGRRNRSQDAEGE